MGFYGRYLLQNDIENAEKYHRKALHLNIKEIHPIRFAFILANMGILKNKQDSIQISKKYFHKKLTLFLLKMVG